MGCLWGRRVTAGTGRQKGAKARAWDEGYLGRPEALRYRPAHAPCGGVLACSSSADHSARVGDLKHAAARLERAQAEWAGHTSGHTPPDQVPAAGQVVRSSEEMVEAPSGFEPEMEVLQTSALPLGDGADHDRGIAARPEQRGKENGAGNGIRTRDFDLGKVALYH